MQLVDEIQDMELPQILAVCPYCRAKLRATSTGGEWDDKEQAWIPECIDFNSECEPDIDDPNWDDWEQAHSLHAFSEWLPVSTTVEKYLAMNFRIKD
jgi:hypothetical protein